MKVAHGHRIRLRLFLEGVEIPVIAAQVECAPNSPAMAVIQIPPLAEATRFHPRTLVHLFFLDMYQADAPFITETGPKKLDEKNPSTYERAQEQEAERAPTVGDVDTEHFVVDTRSSMYKVMFIGEIIGFQWTKNPRNRSVILQCADLSNYWDYAYQWDNTDIFGPGIKAMFSGGATNLFTDFMTSKGSVITSIVSSGKCNTYPKLKGMAAGIVRLIEAIGGTYFPRPGTGNRRLAGQNLFFSIAELRLHLTQMVGAYENDPTTKSILQRQGYSGMFDRALGGQGQQTSIRTAINALTKIIFHEIYPQACPLYIPGTDGEPSGARRMSIKDSPQWSFIATTAKAMMEGLTSVKNEMGALEDTYKDSASGPDARGTFVSKAKELSSRLTTVQKTLQQTITQITGSRAPDTARSIYSTTVQSVGRAAARIKQWTPASNDQIRNLIKKDIEDAIIQLKRASTMTYTERAPKNQEPARLVQQIFRPDIWFGSPPRCNVIFPEQYHQLEYKRMFLQEPTRFMLKTNDEFFGEDFLFDKFYFAPQAGTTREDHARIMDMLKRDMLDHELFTGILPVFEKMGEFNVFAAKAGSPMSEAASAVATTQQRTASALAAFNGATATLRSEYVQSDPAARAQAQAAVDRARDALNQARIAESSATTVAAKTQATQDVAAKNLGKVSFAQRSANFLYFKHRFNSRQLEIKGKFNPYIAAGFPGLIIDKYVDAAMLELQNEMRLNRKIDPIKISEMLGTNFLGNFTQIQHNVAYDNVAGNTTIACSFPRQPEEGVEFLGALDTFIRVKKKDNVPAVRTTDIAAVNPPRIYSMGPNMGRITNVQDVSSKYMTGGSDEWKKLPFFDIDITRKARSSPALVPVRTPIKASETNSAEIINMAGSPDRVLTFSAYSVTEEVPRYMTEDVLWPAEELVRPGWYGDCWSPSQIGKVYNDFLSIGSITDAQTIVRPEGTSSAVSEASQQALAEQQQGESMDDPRVSAPAALALSEGSSIQQACEFIHLTYSYIKQAELDVEQFIRSYTWRPIATMLDMFGTSDLMLSQDGEEVVSGVEGFHSKAFGPYENLFGLVSSEIEDIVGIKRGELAAQRADTRKRKLEKVQEYLSFLRLSRGILG